MAMGFGLLKAAAGGSTWHQWRGATKGREIGNEVIEVSVVQDLDERDHALTIVRASGLLGRSVTNPLAKLRNIYRSIIVIELK
tara:strand:- start:126 stop:374 length:249 start_codon:yes stop_codon:yes gene_type:complete